MVSGERSGGQGEAQLTLSMSGDAIGALDAYLRSGAARGQPFEQALRDALHGRPDPVSALPAPSALSRRSLRRVQEFIAANLARDIRVADIARAASLSAYHLGRSYHRATGQSLWQHVLQARANLAYRLITEQADTSLAEIASLCGFQSYGQFIAAFRKTYGVTPGALRRALEAEEQ